MPGRAVWCMSYRDWIKRQFLMFFFYVVLCSPTLRPCLPYRAVNFVLLILTRQTDDRLRQYLAESIARYVHILCHQTCRLSNLENRSLRSERSTDWLLAAYQPIIIRRLKRQLSCLLDASITLVIFDYTAQGGTSCYPFIMNRLVALLYRWKCKVNHV